MAVRWPIEPGQLLDALGDAVVAAGEEGRIVYANPAAHELLGWPPGTLVGLPLLEVVPERLHHAHSTGFARYQATRVPRLIGGKARVPARRADGGEVEIELTLRAFPGPTGGELYVAVLRDLSELAALARRNELLLGSAADGVYGLDLHGRVTFVNGAAAKMVGYTEDELLGRVQHELVHHHRADGRPYPIEDCPISRTLQEGRHADVDDEVFWRSDGTSFPVEYTASPVQEDGRLTGAVVVFRDVSERRAAQRYRLEAARSGAAEAAARRVLGELQRAILVVPPAVEGLDIGVAFEPGGEEEPTGGDLYDAALLPSGSLHVAVVDVMGHGVAATKQALAVVHTLRALTFQGVPLERLLADAARILERQDEALMGTATVLRIDPQEGVALSSAGHPPALLVRDGAAQWLRSDGITLGWPGATGGAVRNERLGPGDLLVVYTDGLVENKKDLSAGMPLLAETAARLAAEPGRKAQGIAEELVGELLAGAEHCDDSLAFVVRSEPPSALLPPLDL